MLEAVRARAYADMRGDLDGEAGGAGHGATLFTFTDSTVIGSSQS